LGTTINKYSFISVRVLPPFFAHNYRVVWSKVETVKEVAEIQHPVVRAVLQEMGIHTGLEIHHDGDLPACSGLGSSSSFTVGMLNAMYAFQGRMAPAIALANEAIRIEQEVLQEHVGSQDQIWAAFGGINLITFQQDGSFHVGPVILGPARRKRLQSCLMLFFTGLSRYASHVAARKIANMEQRKPQLHTLRQLVDAALAVLYDDKRSVDELGALLHEGWQLKRELADGVTTPKIDEIYLTAREAGALGGKLIGAGGGGFMILYVRPEQQAAVRARLRDLIEVSFEINSPGSKIVIYEPDGLQNSIA
jgi:D-glycero-alpha-D-manno-heptose-7-phosphate kinase